MSHSKHMSLSEYSQHGGERSPEASDKERADFRKSDLIARRSRQNQKPTWSEPWYSAAGGSSESSSSSEVPARSSSHIGPLLHEASRSHHHSDIHTCMNIQLRTPCTWTVINPSFQCQFCGLTQFSVSNMTSFGSQKPLLHLVGVYVYCATDALR